MSRLRIDTIDVHGISTDALRVSALTLLAASPRISMARTRANTNIRSVSKSLRVFPRTKSHTVSAASTIWRSRTRSSGGKLDLGHAFDGLTEVRTEFVCRPQIHRPAEQLRQLAFNLGQSKKARDSIGLELDQEVDIAVGPVGALQHRAKQRETANAVPATQPRQGLFIIRKDAHRRQRSTVTTADRTSARCCETSRSS